VEVGAWHAETSCSPQNIWYWKSQGFLRHKIIPFKLLRVQTVQHLKICYNSFKPGVLEQGTEENIRQQGGEITRENYLMKNFIIYNFIT
jgi:hypothetical protein